MHHHRSSAPEKAKARRASSAGPRTKERVSIKKVNVAGLAKQDRLNALKQARQAKRDEILERKRMGDGSAPAPPKVVVMVPFHTQADTLSLKRQILISCGLPEAQAATLAPHAPVPAVLPKWAQGGPGEGKSRVLLVDPPRDFLSILDVAKCADVLLCVVGPRASLEEPAFDAFGYRVLTALKAQGMGVVVGAVHGPDDAAMLSSKKANDSKKFVSRYFASELGAETRLFPASSNEEVKALVRHLGGVTPKELGWRGDRGYMLAQEAEYSSDLGMLALRGYVRGPGFRCKYLTHLTGHGDFVLSRAAVAADPCPVVKERGQPVAVPEVSDDVEQGNSPDFLRLQPYDPTASEQTWPTDQEMSDASTKVTNPHRRGAKVITAPDASSVPLPDDDDDLEDAGGAQDAGMGDDGGDGDASESGESDAPSFKADTEERWDVSSNMTMEAPNAENVAAERRRRQVLMTARSQEEMEFPDEIDTPMDIPARTRFQKYRGLKSFRTSRWDPYEELPVEYSRIWEFEAFGATTRALKQEYWDECCDMEGGGLSLLYCTVFLKGVPPTVMERQPRGVPFIVSGLLPCEQRVSVVHSTVTREREYEEVLKSKQEVTLSCGFRRFSARPTFSEIPKKSSPCKKYRFMRFLHPGVTACASFYAPVIFPPCNMLMFLDGETGPELVGSGNITGADPKQLIIKRCILTGYPFRTHKSKGVVRFMFFDPTDIKWFKPVELFTKHGLRGHITESLGTHGYMKCRFSGHVKQDDTVCMSLYKRVYPKWHPPAWGGRADEKAEES